LADKNLGFTITNKEWYRNAALAKLNNPSTYQRLENDYILKQMWPNLRLLLLSHNKLTYTSNPANITELAKYILQQEHKPIQAARFYITIKMHKTPPTVRTIINTRNTPTYFASRYLHLQLAPIMKRCPTYLENSKSLIHAIDELYINVPVVLVSADVQELYPSIPIHDGLQALYITLKHHALWNEELILFTLALAKFVLQNNIFEFNSNLYLQIAGTAMGTSFAVAYANIYLHVLEQEVWSIFTKSINYDCTGYPLLNKRYIDDVYLIFPSHNNFAELYINIYNTLRRTIQIVSHIGTSVNFLDLELFLGPRYTREKLIDIKIYQKTMNKYLYIPPGSFHVKSIFKAFITNEIKRYRISCTSDEDFLDIKTKFYSRLIAREYVPTTQIDPLFSIEYTREDLLVDKLPSYTHQQQCDVTALHKFPTDAVRVILTIVTQLLPIVDVFHHQETTVPQTSTRLLTEAMILDFALRVP
jgi:hypothetical protein